MKATVLTPPDGEPVSLSAVKDYLRIGHEGEDALVASLIGSARARLEAELGIALVTRTLLVTLDKWPSALMKRGVRLEPGPVRELVSVDSVGGDGAREDVTSRFVLSGGRLCLRPWSFLPAIEAGGHIEVSFVTGYGLAGSLPADLVLAVKMLAAQGYLLRDGGADSAEDALPTEINDLLAPYKGVRL